MKMTKMTRPLILSVILMLTLASCNLGTSTGTNNPLIVVQPTVPLPQLVNIELTIQIEAPQPTYAVGNTIKYIYYIKNTGTASTPGPVTVTGATATCPPINTIDNKNDLLDVNETIICSSTYAVTQADIDKNLVTHTVTANVNGINSKQQVYTIQTGHPVLELTKTANPITYDHVGQTITYTYTITNKSAATMGPAQFIVTDTGFATPLACGVATITIAPNAAITCTADYPISQADMAAASIATAATASTALVAPSNSATATVTKGTVGQTNPNLVAGTTIKHQVANGEWLWQIARCYGADPRAVSNANPPTPAEISPNTTVTVPNIGSAGKIYGPPCVGTHTVLSGDTWSSIALKYNADPTVLQMVNSNTLTVGSVLKVPLNSAGASTPTTGGTGTCVDLTRSLKLVNLNANITHFNVCGTMDTAGNMKIGTINITQRPEDVGQGGLSQNITSVPVETSTAINNPTSLLVGDMNYDGNDDFRIVKFLPASANIPYLYYIYDPATRNFVYNAAYQNITSPEFPGNFQIRSKWRESATKSGIDTYTIANNTPRLTQRETWEAINVTQATHIVTVFNADGTSQVTVNELVPLPIP
jgi:uncharacterized repeat protein (TIGR01451 family)